MQSKEPLSSPSENSATTPERSPGGGTAGSPSVSKDLKRTLKNQSARSRETASIHQRMENQALREVCAQVNATAQLAVSALRELAMGKMEMARIDAKEASVLLIKIEPGMDLRDDVVEPMSRLFKLPVCVLPKTMDVTAIPPEALEAHGWSRRLVVAP